MQYRIRNYIIAYTELREIAGLPYETELYFVSSELRAVAGVPWETELYFVYPEIRVIAGVP